MQKNWWMHPVVLYVLIFILVIISFFMSEQSYYILYNTEKGIDTHYLFIHILSLVFFISGYLLSKYKLKNHNDINQKFFYNVRAFRAYKIVYTITMIAYIIWYGNFLILHGISILKMAFSIESISENMYIFRYNSGKIPGITSFSEMGVIAVILGVYLVINCQDSEKTHKIKIQLFILFLLTAFRALFFSERLAIIELVVPMLIVYFSFTNNIFIKKISKIFPILSIVGLFIVFGAFEYSRSWLRAYQYTYSDGFFNFIVQRVTGYYTCAINTECLCLKYLPMSKVPYFSFQWFWKLPFMHNIYVYINSYDFDLLYQNLLYNHGNPEFNNHGGLLTFYRDFNYLFPAVQLLFGYLVGKIYRSFLHGNFVSGTLLYPWIVLVILELPRYFLPGNTRSCAVYIAILIVYFCVNNNSSKGSKTKIYRGIT